MAVTLEQLLTHPDAFGLVTATPVQRAICRVADGLPLGDLACDESVVRAMGGAESLALLPTVRPKELYLVAAIRCGKSLFTAALAVRAALTCDLSRLKRHEVPRVSIVSLDLDKADIVLEHLIGAMYRPALEPLLVGKPKARSLRIRREDGRVVEVRAVAGKKAGGSLVSRWSAGVIFDEAPRMNGQEDGVVNFDQSRKAVLGRLLPGAQLAAVGSPWAPRGPIYDAVQAAWGKPSAGLVVIRATGPEMNPIVWTPEACAELRVLDEGAYRTDVLGEFADPESAFLAAAELLAATRVAPLSRPRENGVTYIATMDPATRGNAWTLVVVGKRPADSGVETDDRFFVAFHRQWQGSQLAPLKARAVFAEMAVDLARYGIAEVHTDQWGGDLIAEHGETAQLLVTVDTATGAEKAKRYIDFKTRLNSGGIELAPDPVMRADLLSIRRRLTPTGTTFDLPITRDGRHSDYAPAVILGIDKASGTPSWVDAMNRFASRGGVM